MKTVYTAGGIVLDGNKILLVRKSAGWVLPKGHVEKGETIEQTAVRELLEETGYAVAIIEYCGQLSRPSTEKTGELVTKVIDIFWMRMLRRTDYKTDETSQWVAAAEALTHMAYPAEKTFLRRQLAVKFSAKY